MDRVLEVFDVAVGSGLGVVEDLVGEVDDGTGNADVAEGGEPVVRRSSPDDALGLGTEAEDGHYVVDFAKLAPAVVVAALEGPQDAPGRAGQPRPLYGLSDAISRSFARTAQSGPNP